MTSQLCKNNGAVGIWQDIVIKNKTLARFAWRFWQKLSRQTIFRIFGHFFLLTLFAFHHERLQCFGYSAKKGRVLNSISINLFNFQQKSSILSKIFNQLTIQNEDIEASIEQKTRLIESYEAYPQKLETYVGNYILPERQMIVDAAEASLRDFLKPIEKRQVSKFCLLQWLGIFKFPFFLQLLFHFSVNSLPLKANENSNSRKPKNKSKPSWNYVNMPKRRIKPLSCSFKVSLVL